MTDSEERSVFCQIREKLALTAENSAFRRAGEPKAQSAEASEGYVGAGNSLCGPRRVITSLFVQSFTYAFCNDRRFVIHRKGRGTLKAVRAVRARDEHAEAAFERIGGDPGFVWALDVFATRHYSRFDALATAAGKSFDIEDRERHTPDCSAGETYASALYPARKTWSP